MRKVIPIFLFLLLCLGCSSGKDIKKNEIKKDEIVKTPEIIVVSGKVEIYKQKEEVKVYIVENWKTRSRISYRVKNYEKVSGLDGKIIEARSELLIKESPWAGVINVLQVLKIQE